MSRQRLFRRGRGGLSVLLALATISAAAPTTVNVVGGAASTGLPYEAIDTEVPVGTLQRGVPFFHDGHVVAISPEVAGQSLGYVSTLSTRPHPAGCGVLYPVCVRYTVELTTPQEGDVFRAAVDSLQGTVHQADLIDFAVVRPDGRVCHGASTEDRFLGVRHNTATPFGFEVFLGLPGADPVCSDAPTAGTHQVIVMAVLLARDEVIGDDELEATYRVRALHGPLAPTATIEDRHGNTNGKGHDKAKGTGHTRGGRHQGGLPAIGEPLLPDLVPVLPLQEFSFGCIAGDTPPEKPREERACLRYTFTYGNIGHGMLDLHFSAMQGATEGVTRDVVQRIYNADLTPGYYADNDASVGPDGQPDGYAEVAAGDVAFHETHRHWHYNPFYTIDIYDYVAGVGGTHRSQSGKRGLCSSAWFVADFDTFQSDPPNAAASEGCDTFVMGHQTGETMTTADDIRMPLPAGWADHYNIEQPDNFLDVSDLDSGAYLVTYRINPSGTIRELDRSNNDAYAVVEIARDGTGTFTHVCVRAVGFGSAPDAPGARAVPVPVFDRCA